MAVSLGWHIIFSCFGIAFPVLTVYAEWRGHKRGNPALTELAHTWAKAMGVLFAAGAVSGTLLSFEMGILWPGLMGRFGEVFGFPFVLEGYAFFIEAIFVGIYLFGWNRLSPRAHMLSAVPMIISGAAGAFFVIAANAWMNNPTGFRLDADGQVGRRRAVGGHVRAVDLAADRAHAARGLHGHRVHGRLRLRGRDAPWPPGPAAQVRTADPADVRRDPHARPDRRRRLDRERRGRAAAGQARRDGGALRDGGPGSAVPGRPLLRRRTPLRDRDPVGALTAHPPRHRRRGAGAGGHPGRRAAAGQRGAPGLQRDGRHRVGAAAARLRVRLDLVAPTTHPEVPLVPACRRGLRGGGDPRDGGRLDHHRGRAPAVDRLRHPPDRGRGEPRARPVPRLLRGRGDLRRC